MTYSPEDLKRLYWHSRRGMLELDLLLVPFVKDCLPTLPEREQDWYRRLLDEEDQDLFLWLTRREEAPSAELRQIVQLVLQHNERRGASQRVPE